MELREWIVTLHKHEDLDDFYNDMETPGGNLFIPNRSVEVANRRNTSRNTHYMLTYDEAMLLKADDRVWDVELAEIANLTTKPSGYTITNGQFNKSWSPITGDSNHLNWGQLRHKEAANIGNWGDNGTVQLTSTFTTTASGKHVDVLIVDGHVDPSHPEFAVNQDGTGGSRVVQYNWFQNDIGFGTGTYTYTRSGSYTNSIDVDDNNHGCHVAGTVAGNKYGWARDAMIYNISPYATNPNWGTLGLDSNTYWDYVRAWHNSKPINPVTGRRNPTVSNHSYGSIIPIGQSGFGFIKKIVYRGVTYDPGRDLTTAELQARGCYAPTTSVLVPNYFTSRIADIQDAINDGIIIVAAAGNEYWKTVNSSDQDYNNTYTFTYSGFDFTYPLHRGNGSAAGYAPVINVGAMSNNFGEDKAVFSNCGSMVDVYAAGEAINSSLMTTGNYIGPDPRNNSYFVGKYQGTSMASPQVCGVVALLAESWPSITQAEAHAWIVDNAVDNLMLDTQTDNAMDVQSLQGAPNKILRWINQRVETGTTFPQKNFKSRPTSGITYPRTRIRRRG